MRITIIAIVLAIAPITSAWALTSSTVTFQKDANGYTDVAEMRISYDWSTMNASNARDGTNGTAVTNYLIDGFTSDDPTTPATVEDSDDEQELIKFGSIIGVSAEQIPAGATILDATLTYRTYDTGTTPPSPGPWGVAALNQPFTTATRYADFPSSNGNPLIPYRGAWFEDGADQAIGHPYATRPVGAFAGPNGGSGPTAMGTNVLNGITTADVWPLVQRWVDDPSSNHGFVVQAGFTGQTNGWGFFTSGSGTVANRPKLSVTYTTDPIQKTIIQRGLNSYTGDTVIRLDSGGDLTGAGDDVTIDGSTLTGAYYVDGLTTPGGNLSSLMKFTGVFGANAGQAPDKPVAKAWLVLTTGLNDDNRSPGPFSVHKMLRDWDTTSLYTNFGAVAGFSEADGDIGPSLDANYGATNGAESWFDVTSYLEAVRTGAGAPDFGLAILPQTNDGWAIMLNGATDVAVHPRLVVYSDLSPVGIEGDYNGDTKVNAADYVLWRKNPANYGGSPDGYNTWRANFGALGSGASSIGGSAVPEPTAVVFVLFALIGVTQHAHRSRSSRMERRSS